MSKDKNFAELLSDLRSYAPKRPLSYGESLQLARAQAMRVRRWAEATEPAINLIWLIEQDDVPVHFVSNAEFSGSGLTTNRFGGKVQVFINSGEPPYRQRFSLLHELKHVIDYDDAPVLHARLGSGKTDVQEQQIELIANDFAAHVLMPTAITTRLWKRVHNVELMATMFHVSEEAMTTRLTKLGLIGKPKPRPTVYFRTSGSATLAQQLIECAA